MKKEAESRGAELAPSSLTFGIESGKGVVSYNSCWLKLDDERVSPNLELYG